MASLVIRDGKIAAVGTNVDVPAGAQVIDGKGLQVYPGLFDPVTQMGLSEISAVSATVDTTETGALQSGRGRGRRGLSLRANTFP